MAAYCRRRELTLLDFPAFGGHEVISCYQGHGREYGEAYELLNRWAARFATLIPTDIDSVNIPVNDSAPQTPERKCSPRLHMKMN